MQVQQFQRYILMAVVFIIGWWLVPTSTPAVEVGQPAPDFLMHSTVGESIRLSDYQGEKNVLLFFFLAAFTNV